MDSDRNEKWIVEGSLSFPSGAGDRVATAGRSRALLFMQAVTSTLQSAPTATSDAYAIIRRATAVSGLKGASHQYLCETNRT
jgi:hypothetical protein